MNVGDSPVGLTNEVAGGYTPTHDSTGPAGNKKLLQKSLYRLGEDLEKIRRSNHSSHRAAAAEMMEESEHDTVIKDLLYPALEESEEDSFNNHMSMEFFEDDYAQAQAAAGATGQTSAMSGPSSASHARRPMAPIPNMGSILGQSGSREGASITSQSSFMMALRNGRGVRTYSDVSSEKVRR
jgi:hypothetical protein